MSLPRVSIITIFLNAEKFLDEAIRSVVSQTYGNWEYLLVDDGSTDQSSHIAREWVSRCPEKFRYLEHPGHTNEGMAASRNLGISASKGEFVAFLDADDVWPPLKLAEQIEVLDATPGVAMVYGRAELWHSWTGNAGAKDYTIDLGVPPDSVVEPPGIVTLLLENKAQTPTGVLVRRGPLCEVGGYEKRFRGMFEDTAFLIKFGLRYPIYVSGKCWLRYRQHPASCCALAERNGDIAKARRNLLSWVQSYVKAMGIEDERLAAALQQEMKRYGQKPLHDLWSRVRKAARSAGRRLERVITRRSQAG